MLNKLLLLSGEDIPFPQAQIIIHQPKIKEISLIGEDTFFLGCEIINFSKNLLSDEDKVGLENKTSFDILMSMMREKNPSVQKSKACVMMVLALIFPNYKITFNEGSMDMIEEKSDLTEIHKIDNSNFEDFKLIINEMFCLKQDSEQNPTYNPGNATAAAIAAKLNKGRALAAKYKGEDKKKISILSNRLSILSIGNRQSFNSLCEYTIYQLFDNFKRFQMKYDFDVYFQAKIAGAQNLKEVDHWMEEIH